MEVISELSQGVRKVKFSENFRIFTKIFVSFLRIRDVMRNVQGLRSHQNESAQTWWNQVDPQRPFGTKFLSGGLRLPQTG